MTLLYEEKLAINNTRLLLIRLSTNKFIKYIPKGIRQEAINLSKHYPSAYRIDEVFNAFYDKVDNSNPYDLEGYRDLADKYYAEYSKLWTKLAKAYSRHNKKKVKRRKK